MTVKPSSVSEITYLTLYTADFRAPIDFLISQQVILKTFNLIISPRPIQIKGTSVQH